MTQQEIRAAFKKKAPPKRKKHVESNIQIACVKWFDLQFPHLKQLLFSIPNGGKRGRVTASTMKAEGCRSGIPDLFMSIPRLNYHGLYIEMKTREGYLSREQKQFMSDVEAFGYKFEVCRSVDEFIKCINEYLK